MNLKDFLKKDMKDRNISAQQLADELELSHVMVYYIIKGTYKAGVKSMRKIAELYNIDIREVVIMNDNE